MKIKVLSRNPDDYIRECNRDIHRIQRNYDPSLHPFEAPREYVRALNAVKLDRVFAKPFLGALDGHKDGVICLCKNKQRLNSIFSGSCDGEIRYWNLTTRRCLQHIQAHTGFVRGMTCSVDGNIIISVGDDKTIKYWSTDPFNEDGSTPLNTIVYKSTFTGIDHHWKDAIYATSGDSICIWNHQKADPVRTYKWGTDTVNSVTFNPVETSVCASTASDRSIRLYDIRASAPLKKVIMKMRCNKACWNPMEAFVFTAACEDNDLYTFDMRRLGRAMRVHKDHVDAVLDVDYSPTGKEFVSGSYDKSIRIFRADSNRSREIYHTKRMQRVFCVSWSADGRYVLSGSDETNIRLWKARASEKIGKLTPMERDAALYNEKLKEKYAHHPQIRRIARHRHVPKSIYGAVKEKRTMLNSLRRKETNRIRHSKPGTFPKIPEKSKNIVTVV